VQKYKRDGHNKNLERNGSKEGNKTATLLQLSTSAHLTEDKQLLDVDSGEVVDGK
jgi:hypothetical protein